MSRFWPEGALIDTKENRTALHSPLSIADACARRQILEARALVCDSQHNLIVDLGCMKGMIPRTEGAVGITEGSVRDIALISRVGKPVSFVITSLGTDPLYGPVAYLSRKQVQEQCYQEYITKLRPGMVISARVNHLEPFGAFCDIGCGISSLLPIDSISVSRISHPSDRLIVGSLIRVVVKSTENGRITLSQKELLGTWEENAAMFSQGETVSGIVRSIEDYGIFVELTPNLAGLAEPRDGTLPGQQASVYIKSILPEKMKIKLILIDSFSKPAVPSEPRYFFTGNYLKEWVYSPPGSGRQIQNLFE